MKRRTFLTALGGAVFAWPLGDGGLMSYGPILPDIFARTAYFIDKVLKGAKPVDLPMEQLTKFDWW